MPRPNEKPAHWDEDTWYEVIGDEGYGDGWEDVEGGEFWMSGTGLPDGFRVRAADAFQAIDAAYKVYPDAGYIEIESWGN